MSNRVKILNPAKKKDSMVRDIRQCVSRSTTVEEFKDQLPPTTRFSVGYFIGCLSMKKWIVTQEDLEAMYTELIKAKKTQVCLWCEGGCDESQGKRRSIRYTFSYFCVKLHSTRSGAVQEFDSCIDHRSAFTPIREYE